MTGKDVRAAAIRLRRSGKTYAEIRFILNRHVPKSTLSHWCSGVILSKRAQNRIAALSDKNLLQGRHIALEVKQRAREEKFRLFDTKNKSLYTLFKNSRQAKKIALAMLYLGEGSKGNRGSLMFGNSNPGIVSLFMSLLRSVFIVDERKFRVTVQCRADQDINVLNAFWSECTKVPASQFYKAQVDKRTINKPTKMPDYKGVCRIDYFSSDIDLELRHIAKELEKM